MSGTRFGFVYFSRAVALPPSRPKGTPAHDASAWQWHFTCMFFASAFRSASYTPSFNFLGAIVSGAQKRMVFLIQVNKYFLRPDV
jgi:hypothetical protein